MEVKKLNLFSVSVIEKDSAWCHEHVYVVAENRREARRKGVMALEQKELINRLYIRNSIVVSEDQEIYS